MLSGLATFWMVGNISVAGLAWLISPADIGTSADSDFIYNSWRIFVAICGLPALAVCLALLFMPESPRFLLSKGLENEALKVFQMIFRQNTGAVYGSDYPVTRLRVDRPRIYDSNAGKLSEILKNTFALFDKPLFWVTIMMLYINFSIQFG